MSAQPSPIQTWVALFEKELTDTYGSNPQSHDLLASLGILLDAEKMIVKHFEDQKTKHELPNGNSTDYNRGFVSAMNQSINMMTRS
jgi:hypothetical protein